MRWILVVLAICASASAAAPVEAQTRADTAAVLLHAAEQLRARGETAAARALLDYLRREYAETAAAEDARRMQVALRRVPQERSGRVELLVGGAMYGAWLGVAVPIMTESDAPEAYGLGFLAGAPVGFLAARAYAQSRRPTLGQARAITFGATWGTLQGLAWGEILDIGERRYEWGCDPVIPDLCYEDVETPASKRVGAAIVGGLAGIGTGAFLARKPITASTAAVTSTSAAWATWFGFGAGFLADQEDDALLTTMMLTGNAALVGSALLAPRWHVTEGRVRLVSVGGIIGGLTGVGLLLLVQPDDEKVAMSIPLLTSAAGLAVGIVTTRDRDIPADASGGGAVIRIEGQRWALDTGAPSLRLQRAGTRYEPVVYVPLLRARF